MKEYKKYATTIDIDLYNYVKNNKKNENFCYGCTSAIESMFVDEFNDNYLTLSFEERLNYLHNIEEICRPSFSDNSIYCDNLEKINTENVIYEKGSLKNFKRSFASRNRYVHTSDGWGL
jgi:hypothetical protein